MKSIDEKRYDKILAEIKRNINQAHEDEINRKELIKKIETHFCEYCDVKDNCNSKTCRAMLYYAPTAPIDLQDILPFHSMLNSVGVPECLVLIITSMGGIGPIAEKIVDLCYKHCKNQFIVVVPTFAKSAATLIALSAKKIIMGETSELGPIDAQVPVMAGGIPQPISAQDYIDSRDELEEKIKNAVGKNEPIQSYLAQITTLNQGYLKFCEHSMEFGRDFAKKKLDKKMFEKYQGEIPKAELINEIAVNFSSRSKHMIHGRMITYDDIIEDQHLKHLNIKKLESDFKCWGWIEHLIIRADIYLNLDNRPPVKKIKLLQSTNFNMTCIGTQG